MRFLILLLAFVVPGGGEPTIEILACEIGQRLVPPLLERAFDPDPAKLHELVGRFDTWPDDKVQVIVRAELPAGNPKAEVSKMRWVKQEKSGHMVGHSYKSTALFGGYREFILKQPSRGKNRPILEAHLSAPLTAHWAISALSQRDDHAIVLFERLRGGPEDAAPSSTWIAASLIPTKGKLRKRSPWQAPAGDDTVAHYLLRLRAPSTGEAHFKLADGLQFWSALNNDTSHGGYVQGKLTIPGGAPPKLGVSMERSTFEHIRSRTEARGRFGGAVPAAAYPLGEAVTIPLKGRLSTQRIRAGEWHGVSTDEVCDVVGRVIRFRPEPKE